ncbi:unnamed protein product [Medioppia subpectinata]|uniref:Cytochrome P450 n=1 Tax=Medioppia subpectinata TaxID=1979941 RepID=A0A7R9KVN5_9ACAR|nr:unnamed protein product [Medioppia subpectinata]CAG2110714.1 unnamed protein product [Medioppia subpectinata]
MDTNYGKLRVEFSDYLADTLVTDPTTKPPIKPLSSFPLFAVIWDPVADPWATSTPVSDVDNVFWEFSRENTYDESNDRDFCDQFIGANRRAESESKPGFEYLNRDNSAAVIMDMYLAGPDTTSHALLWLILLMTYYSDWQNVMRQEISDQLGDRAPVVDDKQCLPNVMAFLYETVRYRNAAPLGSPHMALEDMTIGLYGL